MSRKQRSKTQERQALRNRTRNEYFEAAEDVTEQDNRQKLQQGQNMAQQVQRLRKK